MSFDVTTLLGFHVVVSLIRHCDRARGSGRAHRQQELQGLTSYSWQQHLPRASQASYFPSAAPAVTHRRCHFHRRPHSRSWRYEITSRA